MRSKLEPGCRAIIVEGDQTGLILKCIDFIGKPENINDVGFAGFDYWSVDQSLSFTDGSYYEMCRAYMLQRIDDHPENETIMESQNLEV